ncbi:hypothetical protein CcrC1_gp007 [Caulobacter phage C1]|nr:hypothetical protein CcrC1_gp500 [Caulobacter phage C1]UTU08235.1 hypothetical protein CcrC2_gp485 [Caulobacter phage C2]UTU09294.1 hypothetical protein CcrBL47_gp524 [Caulobacter phage BL47]UTU09870.1 hypothetical protein CcrRB23_gp503 [Caulobacter phage RB23]WGN96894.1 hypothetical protein [Bertelyvirus sp.]
MALPEHLFIADHGDLYDTRVEGWSAKAPLRRAYRVALPKIESMGHVKAALRYGDTTDLGGYPLYFVTRDGAALSFESARKMLYQIALDFQADASTGWRIAAVQINYEDGDLRCDHSGERIPCAYNDPEVMAWASGSNVSGFMPDNEPSHHATWEEARDALKQDIEFAREACEEGSEEDGQFAHVLDVLATLQEGAEFNYGANGYRWWVEKL